MDSNYVLENNKNSQIIKVIKEHSSTISNLSDFDSAPNNYRSVVSIQSVGYKSAVPTSGTKYIFPINSTQFLRKLILKVVLTSSDDLNIGMAPYLGSYLFKRIYLLQNGNVLSECNPGYILSRVHESDHTRQNYYDNIMSANWSNSTATVYVPIFSWFFDHSCNSILLDYSKNLELQCEYNDEINWITALTNFQPTLQVFRMCYEPEFISQYIRSKLISLQDKTTFLNYDTILQKESLSNGSSSIEIDITNNILLQALHLTIFNTDYTTVSINSISLRVQNHIVIDSVDRFLNIMNTEESYDDFKQTSINVSNQGNNEYVYFFGSKTRLGFSGALDISQSPVKLIVNYTTLTSDATLYINLEHMRFCDLSNKTGRYNVYEIH